MSFKIFTLQLFGGLKPIEAIEKKRKALYDDFAEFRRVESSDELKKYLELEKEINSAEFKKKKSEIESLSFKGSKEFNQLKEFGALQKKRSLKNYFKIAGSQELEKYNKLKTSGKIEEFFSLQKYIKSEQYAADKKKKEHSEAVQKNTRYKELKVDADIKFFQHFEKSSLYRNYLNVDGSSDLKRFKELEEIVNSNEFKERKAYLEDKKKWEKTDEFAHQQEFLAMQKLPHLVKYFKNKGTTIFKFFDDWNLVFEDDFSKPSLDTEKWSTKSYLAEKHIGDNYSLLGDNHVFTDGKNIKLNGNLSIQVKKEKAVGKVWHQSSGFVPVELDYTSGVISSWKNFWIEDGLIEAKIKFNPVQQLVSSFYL